MVFFTCCFILHTFDESVAQEYKRELVDSLGEQNDSDDPVNLWTDFKTKVPKLSGSCLRDTPRTSKSFLTKEILNITEESRRVGLEGRTVPEAQA